MIFACLHATYMQRIGCFEMNISTAKNASSKLEVLQTDFLLGEATATIKFIDQYGWESKQPELLVPMSIQSPNAEIQKLVGRLKGPASKPALIASRHHSSRPYIRSC